MHRSPAVRLALALFACLFAFPAFAAVGDLYVTSDASDVVRMYDPTSGAFLGNFTSSVNGAGQLAIHFGTTNNRVLVGHFGGGVDEFDATTGGFIKTYNPGGGCQWAGLYGPTGDVLIGSWVTNDVRKYDASTGAFLGVLCAVPMPADMRIGPNGNLFVCSYSDSMVVEVDATGGSFVNSFGLPFGARTNDIEFNPNGQILVTAMGTNVTHVYDSFYNPIGFFAGSFWARPHGIEMHPVSGQVMAVDGVTGQTHEFDATTYLELNPSFLAPTPGDKIVDLAFRPPGGATPARNESWGRIKRLYR